MHGTVIKTTDSGNNWENIFNNYKLDYSYSFSSLQFINTEVGYIIGYRTKIKNVIGSTHYSNTNSIVLTTSNGGLMWKEHITPYKQTFNSLYFLNSKTGYIVGDSGLILKTTSGCN
ncbi:MAG: hypothetical protein NTU73_14200 [Ignavibacteriae bacterium]|nr:hypothetical protein [Ignavibacteriota bacterium]